MPPLTPKARSRWCKVEVAAICLVLSLPLASGCKARGADQAVIRDSAGLMKALAAAGPDTTIRLGGGLYGPLVLPKGATRLTITSADARDRAIFSSIVARRADGLRISTVDVVSTSHDPERPYLVEVEGGKGIGFDRLSVRGAAGGERFREYALWLRNASHVEVTRSSFSGTRYGIGLLNSSHISLTANEFSGLQTDGIRGGGVDDLAITGNVLTGFTPKPGEHPDGIQLWSTNQTSPAKGITIRDNLIARGLGRMTQGIFVRDTNGKLPFEDVVIEGNLIVGSMFNGIAVLGLDGGRIANNKVVAFADQRAWIRVDGAQNTTITGNIAPQFLANGKAAAATGNTIAKGASSHPGAEVRDWLAKRPWLRESAGPHLMKLASE